MTATTRPTTIPPCPDWCQNTSRLHRDDFDSNDPHDGLPIRCHSIEYDDLEASTDNPEVGMHEQPHVFVNITRVDKEQPDGSLVIGVPRVGVVTVGYPHFTAAEARRHAALVLGVADRADEIAAGR